MRPYKAILSFLLLAVIGCSVAQEGYQYPKPTIGFSDGYKNVAASTTVRPSVTFGGLSQGGQQQQVRVTPKPQTVKPAASSGQYQQSHTTFQGLTSSVSPKPVIAAVKPQTSFGGIQGSGQSTVQKPVVVPGQYKVPVVDTLKLQTGFGVPQGLEQSTIQKPTVKPQNSFGGIQSSVQLQKPAVTSTSFGQIGQHQAVSAGQYQKPLVSQEKPELSYLPPKTQTSTLTVNKPQVAFQGFTSSAATPRPVVATIKPQASFSGFQSQTHGFSNTQSIAQKPTVVTGQYQKPATITVSKPEVAFQGFTSSAATPKPVVATARPQTVVTGQYQKPATLTVSKPQVAFQGFTNSAATPKPVIDTVKPQTNFGQTVIQKPAVTTTIFSQFGKVPAQQIAGAGHYQTPHVSQQKPAQQVAAAVQYQKPVVSQQKPVLSYLPPHSQTTTLTANKPQVTFQGFTTSAATPKPVVATAKPQTGFSGFQGFSQSTVQKPAVVTGQYQKPATITIAKPQVAFQGFTSSAATPKPVVATAKPQTGFSAFQGFSQSTVQKPAVVTGQYQKPATITIAKPQVAFQGFTSSAATPKPVVATAKPQTGFSAFQGFSQSTVQKPAVVTGQYQKAATNTVAKPTVTFQGFTSSAVTPKPVIATVKPQTSFGQAVVQKPAVTTTIFSQFGQVPAQKIAGAGQYQKPLVSEQKPVLSYLPPKSQTTTLTVNKPQVTFQGFTSSAATPKPVVAAKPQTGFSGFQGFSQSTVQKPAIVTGQYQKPATITVAKPQVAFQGFTSSAVTPKPVIATVKPQTSFGQAVVQKPAVTTTIFSQFGKVPAQQIAGAGHYQTPLVSQQKPAQQVAAAVQYQKPVVSQQKPVLSYLPPQSQTTTLTANKPQVTFQGFTSSATTSKPVVATAKPQTGFSGFQGFSQSTVQKPAVVTGQYQKPATITVTKPQVTFQGFTSSATTSKPVVATAKPQTGFSGFQGFSQSTVQKPAVVTGQYQKPATITVTKPQVAFQGFTSSAATPKPVVATAKPQTGFSGFQGFSQSTVQKPAVVTGQYQKPATITVAKPHVAIQGFTSSPATPKPVVATAKPQASFSGFQGFSQSTVQKPAVVTGQYQKPATITVAKPHVAFQGFTNSAGSKPQTGFSAYQSFSQSTVQKPTVTTTTTKFTQPQVSSQNVNLEYLPPVGAAVPKNIVKSSGAPSQSFFELSSTTANQVVDAAREQKVAGFVVDENIEPTKAYTSLRSGLPSVPQTIFSAAQKQKVEKHSTFIDPHYGYQTSPQSSISQIETNEITGSAPDELGLNDQYGEFHSQTLPAVSLQQVVNHQFGGLQSQTSQAIPAQQIVKTQLTVLDRGQTSVQGSYQVVEPTGHNLNQLEFSSQNFGHSEYRTPVDIQDEAQNLEYYPNTSELSAEQSSSSSNRYHVVRPQVQQESPVQNPQPLNRDEQQVRRLQEKADSDNDKHFAKTLRPGSHIGQHVNKDSDKEYNVFDYDQYSTDPDETEI